MRLNTFICENMDEILVQWENFASSLLPAAGNMSKSLLRIRAKEILEAIVKDISAPQTALACIEKSKGLIQKRPGGPKTAAETHGMLTALSGFEIKQLASEYRALRASVVRLWLASCKSTSPHLEEVVRFNEAIDQALNRPVF